MMTTTPPSFPSLLQDFFSRRLLVQRNASARTVTSYRDTFCLLLSYAQRRTGKSPTDLLLADLDAPLVLDFLDHLETERQNSVRSRNARLAGIRSFLRYAALSDPASLPSIGRVLAIPTKRFERAVVGFLSREETEAILAAPDASTWSGHRDQVMLATFYNTGARVSEIIGLRVQDAHLDRSASLHIHGKGRKQRVVPLWKSTAANLREWLARTGQPAEAPLFPSRDGRPLSRSGVEDRLRVAVAAAAQSCPTLKGRQISPHTLRHTTAMHLLQSGVDITVIALWLGHESPATTHLYLEADLAMKERALKKLDQPPSGRQRFRPGDSLLAFLESL
jgi:site-specific recombinase XerD